MNTKELIDRIFKEPGIKFELTEFENLGKPIHDILAIYPKTSATGKEAGKTKYYLKSFLPFSTGNEEVQVYSEGGKSAPEEIVRQLWVYKLIHQYGYKADEIDLEKSVQFGVEVGTKADPNGGVAGAGQCPRRAHVVTGDRGVVVHRVRQVHRAIYAIYGQLT